MDRLADTANPGKRPFGMKGSAQDPAGPSSRPRKRLLLIGLGSAYSIVLFLASQLSMLIRAGVGLGNFRTYFSFDQLANFAMVVNGAHGNSASVEPFTETGTMVDPHLYFSTLGRISDQLHVSPIIIYNVAGIGLQILFVAGLSIGFVLITRRWWSAYFGALPYLIGTLASLGGGNWFATMSSHAIVWGAFGEMFALNSQSCALIIAGLLLTLVLVVAKRHFNITTITLIAVAVGAGIGLLANIDTYNFFGALFFAVYGLSIYAMVVARRSWPAATSGLLFVLLFALGGTFASAFGRVAVFGLALLPALPGIWLLIARWRSRSIAPLIALVATASPQLITVLFAIHSGDAFLKFRENSSAGLSISWNGGLFHAAPLLLPLLLILLAGLQRKNALWIAYSAGSMIAWFLLAGNNLWGANQEPYQFWDIGFALSAFTIIPIVIDVALAYRLPRVSRHDLSETKGRRIAVKPLWIAYGVASVAVWLLAARTRPSQVASGPHQLWTIGLAALALTMVPIIVDAALFPVRGVVEHPQGDATQTWRVVISALLMVSIGVAELSAIDWYNFYQSQEMQSISLSTPEDVALLGVSSHVTNHLLVLTGACIDPELFKDATGARVAYYSEGLAWPSRYRAINKVDASIASRTITDHELKNAGIGWLVTSSGCSNHWSPALSRRLVPVAHSRFGASSRDVITLWRL